MSKPLSNTIGTTSVLVFGDRAIVNAKAWATGGAIAVSDYCNSNGRIYFAITAGTAGVTAPSHQDGDVSDGAVTWRTVPMSPRVMFAIANIGSTIIYGAIGADAVAGKGIVILSNGTWYEDQKIQGPISLISSAAGGSVAIQEV